MAHPNNGPLAVERKQGRIGKALIRLFMKRATIIASEALSDRFRLVSLEGPELREVQWTPGQKVQIAMGSAFVARTYTPIAWDADQGRTRILGFAHGAGPGSEWLRRVKAGDECDVFGPRASLGVRQLEGPFAIFGDESSLGLACALTGQYPHRLVAGYFEADDAADTAAVAVRLGMAATHVFGRSMGEAHIVDLEATLPGLIASGHVFVLTGKAGTVQRLRQKLKEYGVPSGRIRAKAYLAPGKVGMD
jgi:NADPH-dependent ferric siderophore reductase